MSNIFAGIQVSDTAAMCKLSLPWRPEEIGSFTANAVQFVGDVRLSELRSRLQQLDIAAEFDQKGGLFVGGGKLYVTKGASETDDLKMEGSICEEYWVCRDLIYEIALVPLL